MEEGLDTQEQRINEKGKKPMMRKREEQKMGQKKKKEVVKKKEGNVQRIYPKFVFSYFRLAFLYLPSSIFLLLLLRLFFQRVRFRLWSGNAFYVFDCHHSFL